MSKPASVNQGLYREFRRELDKLTFNSKPIINDLSKRAQLNMADAETVIWAIEEHLRFTAPKFKLPAFYLLDSIAKNVGDMYISLLHGRIARIFVDVWRSVDDAIKAKLERTMRTWRNGFEGGQKNLFPEFVLRKIEEDINRHKARAKAQSNALPEASGDDLLENLTGMQHHAKKRALEERRLLMQREADAQAGRYSTALHRDKRHRVPAASPVKDARTQVLRLVNEMLVKKKVEMLRRPNDATLFTVVNTLKDIKTSVSETRISPEQIEVIRQQLIDLEKENAAGNSGSTTPPYPPPGYVAPVDNPNPANGRAATEHSADSSNNNGSSGGAADAGQLLQNIMARPDLISSLSKVAPGLSSSLGSILVPAHQPVANYKEFDRLEPIALSHASVARRRPGIHEILYGRYANLCSQCGWRTRQGDVERMKKHMDWHFRRNLRQQGGRDRRHAARGWYLNQTQWEAGPAAEEEDQPGSIPVASTPGSTGNKAGEDDAEKTAAELRRMTVTAPPNHNEPCGICKEAFERRFNEDEEDWELINAVSVDGTVFHATCHAGSH